MDSSYWKSIEMMGYAHYAAQGYTILVQLVGNSGFDFVILKDGTYKRVNVKVAALKDKNNPTSWSIARSVGVNYRFVETVDNLKCDIYLAWLPHEERFIELEGDFFTSISPNTTNRRIPKEILNKGK